MTWQTAILLHLVFSAGFALVHRSVSKDFASHSKVAVAFMYLGFVSPLGIIYALFNYDINFNFSLTTWIYLVLAGFLFAYANIAAYKSNAHIDAAQFAILSNTSAIFTVIIAAIFLDERMTPVQLLGVVILVSAAGLVSIRRTTKRTFEISSWSVLAIISSLLLGGALTFEKHLLGQMNIGTYMVIGWGLQTLAMAILAAGQWHTFKDFDRKAIAQLSSLGIFRFLQGVTFVVAVSQADIGLVTSMVSYKAVLIFAGGVLLLHERSHMLLRLFGSILATVGLLLLF